MHKTDLIWGGTWGSTANFWGACAPQAPLWRRHCVTNQLTICFCCSYYENTFICSKAGHVRHLCEIKTYP